MDDAKRLSKIANDTERFARQMAKDHAEADTLRARVAELEAKLTDWERRSESCESKLGQLEANERVMELESALAKSASREAALNTADTGVCAFKEWYDAIWLGDQEHGQTLPKSGPEYDRYMDGYTLAYGAWNAALAKIKEAS